MLWCQPTVRQRDNTNMVWQLTVEDRLRTNFLVLLKLQPCLLRSVMGFEISQIGAGGINLAGQVEVEHIHD